MQGQKNAGFYVGAYYYAYPESMDDPILEADYFVDTVKNTEDFEGNLPPVIDLETIKGNLHKDQLSEWARIWMEHMMEKFSIKPILYT